MTNINNNRDGRRASDGLVAQGILHSHSEYPMNTGVAFNSESLHESSKSKGILELHLLQKEAAHLKTKYEANVSLDEMAARQHQHSQFYVVPISQNSQSSANAYYAAREIHESMRLASLRDMGKYMDSVQQHQLHQQQHAAANSIQFQKHPLQQQLMQHRLLQQKRHIFQKQVNSEPGVNRRHIFRQQSYKFAQQQPIGPMSGGIYADIELLDGSLPYDEPSPISYSPELQTSYTPHGSPIKIRHQHGQLHHHHNHHQHQQAAGSSSSSSSALADCWTELSGSMQLCQISENYLHSDNWMKTSQPSQL